MNRRKISFIIVLMCVALAGIISVQVSWVKNALEVKEKQFEQNVFSAMKNIVINIEKLSYAIKLNGNLIDLNSQNKSQIYHPDTNNLITIIPVDEQTGDLKNVLDFNRKRDSIKKIIEFVKDKSDQIKNTVNNLEEVYKQLKVEIENSENPLERLNLELLDSVIYKELSNTGIYLKFEFAVVSEKNKIQYKSKYFSSHNLSSKFKLNLFPNDVNEKDYVLILAFHNIQKEIYTSVITLLLLSVLFTLIIIIVFIVTLRVILKQKKLSEIKSDFINNISHELKTPIASLKVAIQTLKLNRSDIDTDIIDLIERQGNRLQKITDNVIDTSFNNIPVLNKEKVNAFDLMMNIAKEFKISRDFENLNFEYHINIKPDNFIYSDDYYFTAAVNNVLENAVNYNDKPEKRISLTANVHNQFLLIEIEDNGIGIKEKDKKNIFDKFYRGTEGNIHNVKGLGIGLFFSKQIIELHSGKVYFESKEKIGTKFFIKIPVYE